MRISLDLSQLLLDFRREVRLKTIFQHKLSGSGLKVEVRTILIIHR